MPAANTLDDFWARILVQPYVACWTWIGKIRDDGYAHFCWQGRKVLAHRFMYEQTRGPIPATLMVDHLCRNRSCVSPAHLETVSNRTNVLRGISFAAENAKKDRCPRGHPYDLRTSSGGRWCRICRRVQGLRWYYETRARRFPGREIKQWAPTKPQ